MERSGSSVRNLPACVLELTRQRVSDLKREREMAACGIQLSGVAAAVEEERGRASAVAPAARVDPATAHF
eukprot:11191172-Lingulodinium_polyedra.AAC.1